MLAKFTKTDINVRFYNSGQILLVIILILAKLMCNLKIIFAFFIVIRWYKMHINAILAYQFISEYPVKSYKIALFVIKCW